MNMTKMKPFAKAGLTVAMLACAGASFAGADHMVVAVQQLPVIVEPQGINNNALDRVAYSIYETLIRADLKTGELYPGLAESWKRISPETVEFKLRKGVKFHDGSDFTADDVVFLGDGRVRAHVAASEAATDASPYEAAGLEPPTLVRLRAALGAVPCTVGNLLAAVRAEHHSPLAPARLCAFQYPRVRARSFAQIPQGDP